MNARLHAPETSLPYRLKERLMMNTRKIAQATRHHLATFSAVGTLVLSSALLVA